MRFVLANENDTIVNGASVYTPVTPDHDWSVTGLLVNTLAGIVLDPTATPWDIRTGVSEGNGGGTGETNNTCSNTVTVTAPDLTATKTNNVSGSTALGNSWTWTVALANSGNAAATARIAH